MICVGKYVRSEIILPEKPEWRRFACTRIAFWTEKYFTTKSSQRF